MVVDGTAQMRQVDATERTVPVTAIALTAIQFASCPVEILALRTILFGSFEAPADHHHTAVHFVSFRIFHFEIAPEATAQKR